MTLQAANDYSRLVFDENAALVGPDGATLVTTIAASGATDLFVMSHGWGNQAADAENLYAAMFPLIDAALPNAAGAAYLGVFWPSIWFPDAPAGQSAEVASAVAAGAPGQADAVQSGAEIATALAVSLPAHADALHTMGALIDAGVAAVDSGAPTDHDAALGTFHSLFQSVFATPQQATEDSGESHLINTADPRTAYAAVSEAMGSAPPAADTQGLGDVFGTIWNGAKDALRVGSYYTMKGRAGTIGAQGLGPFLTRLHQAAPGLRVHLIGHSFGARLVSYSLAGIPSAAASPIASVTLVQGAFSHWCFTEAAQNPFGSAGGLCGVTDRVHGPYAATFTSADWAVGVWYPKASCLAGQDAQDYEGPGRWAGMGSDGYQGVSPTAALTLPLGAGTQLDAGTFYDVDANAVITDTSQSSFAGAHSDIRHPEVAALIAAAATA
ncbi:MAG: serine/threonine protein kinase [Nostocoides sp.]